MIIRHFFQVHWAGEREPSPKKESFPGRKNLVFSIALVAIILSSSYGLVEAPAASLPDSATVTHVVDGDSCVAHFADGFDRGVRLIGINAPELTDDRENVRYWAFLAKRFATHYLEGSTIRLEYDWNTWDKYGRVLAYVRLGSGGLFNELILSRGFAYIFLLYPFRKDYQEAFRSAQHEAVQQGRGLWGKEPPLEIALSEVRGRLGEYVTVRFTCARVTDGKSYIFVSPAGEEMQVLISKESALLLPPAGQFKNKEIAVAGVLEKGKNRPRIYVLFQRQLSVGKF
jgi:micrococcal nuclease